MKKIHHWTTSLVFLGLVTGVLVVHCISGGHAQSIALDNLSDFQDPGSGWNIVGNVTPDPKQDYTFRTEDGTGVLYFQPRQSAEKSTLLTTSSHGDLKVELDIALSRNARCGLILQGRYQVQLADSWSVTAPSSADHGGIRELKNSTEEKIELTDGSPPRQNASRAPGLWQHLTVAFQAPKFDENGRKIQNARIVHVRLNGITIQEDVPVHGPTRGAIENKEAKKGPLVFLPQRGEVAFRNMNLRSNVNPTPPSKRGRGTPPDPIYLDASDQRLLRSFRDLPGGHRVTHAISVSSPKKVHYTYDLNHGRVVQVWRGDFLNMTPMWHDRGDGSSDPRGMVLSLTKKPHRTIGRLSSKDEKWGTHAKKSNFRPEGFKTSNGGRPTFCYRVHETQVRDTLKVLKNGTGFRRKIKLDDPSGNLYVRLAKGKSIKKLGPNQFLVEGKNIYIQLDKTGGGDPVLRNVDNHRELLIPAAKQISYTIKF